MARLTFSKWEGTGNDFIVIDDRDGSFPATATTLVRHLCDRNFGIGSDGLILVQRPREQGTHFHMEFFNPDTSQSFCGNGSRCAFAFFAQCLPQGTLSNKAIRFTAIDGEHSAAWDQSLVHIGMRDVAGIERIDDRTDLIYTGSPHLLLWVDDPEEIDIVAEAHQHRYGECFKKEGVNVNFMRWHEGRIEMRTYERGVEAETLSCGTGVTAAALSAMSRGFCEGGCDVHTRGGDLIVRAARDGDGGFKEVSLAGPVREVFKGEVEI